MVDNNEDDDLEALRAAVLASRKKTLKEEVEEDPELFALRAAALLTKKSGISDTTIKEATGHDNERTTTPPVGSDYNPSSRSQRRYHRPQRSPDRNSRNYPRAEKNWKQSRVFPRTNYWDTTERGQSSEQYIRRPPLTQKNKLLLRPQDRWIGLSENDSAGGSDSSKTKVQDKFSRYNSSESDSDEGHESENEHENSKQVNVMGSDNEQEDDDLNLADEISIEINEGSQRPRLDSHSSKSSITSQPSSGSPQRSKSRSNPSSRASTPPKILEENTDSQFSAIVNSPSKLDRKSKFGRAKSRSFSEESSNEESKEESEKENNKSADEIETSAKSDKGEIGTAAECKPKDDFENFLEDIDAFLDDDKSKEQKDTSTEKHMPKNDITKSDNKLTPKVPKKIVEERSGRLDKEKDTSVMTRASKREYDRKHERCRVGSKYHDNKNRKLEDYAKTSDVKLKAPKVVLEDSDSASEDESSTWRQKTTERSSVDIAQERRKRVMDVSKIDKSLEPELLRRNFQVRNRGERIEYHERFPNQKRQVRSQWESESDSDKESKTKSLISVPAIKLRDVRSSVKDRLRISSPHDSHRWVEEEHVPCKRSAKDRLDIKGRLSVHRRLGHQTTVKSLKRVGDSSKTITLARTVNEEDDVSMVKTKVRSSHGMSPVRFSTNTSAEPSDQSHSRVDDEGIRVSRRRVTTIENEPEEPSNKVTIKGSQGRDAVDDLDEKIKRIKERNRQILERQLEIEKEKEMYG